MNTSLDIQNLQILFKFKTKAYSLYQELNFSQSNFENPNFCLLENIFRKIDQKFKEKKIIEKSQIQQIQKLQSQILNLKQDLTFLNQNIQFYKNTQNKLKERISNLNEDCARTTERLIWRQKQNQVKQAHLFELKNIIKQKDQQVSQIKKLNQEKVLEIMEEKRNLQMKLSLVKQEILRKQQRKQCNDTAIMTEQQQVNFHEYEYSQQALELSSKSSQVKQKYKCYCDSKFNELIKDLQNKNHFLYDQYQKVQRYYENLKDEYEKFTKKTYAFVLQNIQLRNKNVTLNLQIEEIKKQIALLKDHNLHLIQLLLPSQRKLQKKLINQNLQNTIIPKQNMILLYKSKQSNDILLKNSKFFDGSCQQESPVKNQQNSIIQSLNLSNRISTQSTSYSKNIWHQIKQINSMDGSLGDNKLDNQTKADSMINSDLLEENFSTVKKCLKKSETYNQKRLNIVSPQMIPDLTLKINK